MACGTGFCAGKIIAGVLGIGAASVLGFNWITTGCPTGVCPTERAAQVAITAASLDTAAPAQAEGPDACCAPKAPAEAKADACCPAEAATTTIAATKLTPATDACCALMAETTTAAVIPVSAPAADPLAAAPEGECCADKGATQPCNDAKACCKENFGIATNSPAETPATP